MDEACVFHQGIVEGTDYPAVPGMLVADILGDCAAVAGQRVPVQFACVEELRHDGGEASCAEVFFSKVFAGGLHVQ